MSKMKDLMALTAFSMAAAASGADVYGIKPGKRTAPQEWTRKQCKSCKFIDMTEGWHATCTARHHYLTNPKGAACSQWQHK